MRKVFVIFMLFIALVGCGVSDIERIKNASVSSDADYIGKIVNINKDGDMVFIELFDPEYDMPVEFFITEETELFDSKGNKLNSHGLKEKDLVEVWTEVQFGALNMALKVKYIP